MVITNKQARIIGIASVNIMPGANVFTGVNEAALIAAMGTVQSYVSAGILVVEDYKKEAPAVDKASTPAPAPVADATSPVDEIKSLSSKDAVKLVSTILDRQLLSQILESDGRSQVQKVAKAQVAKIDATAKETKETQE